MANQASIVNEMPLDMEYLIKQSKKYQEEYNQMIFFVNKKYREHYEYTVKDVMEYANGTPQTRIIDEYGENAVLPLPLPGKLKTKEERIQFMKDVNFIHEFRVAEFAVFSYNKIPFLEQMLRECKKLIESVNEKLKVENAKLEAENKLYKKIISDEEETTHSS